MKSGNLGSLASFLYRCLLLLLAFVSVIGFYFGFCWKVMMVMMMIKNADFFRRCYIFSLMMMMR